MIQRRGRNKPRFRGAAAAPTTEAQQARNRKAQLQRLARRIAANFSPDGQFVTLTFAPGREPDSAGEARKRFSNFLRRLKRAADKPVPYIYVIERGKGRFHIHMVTAGEIPAEMLKDVWEKEGQADTRPLDSPDTVEELAGYLLKEQETGSGKRAWGASKGLIKPEIFEEEISDAEYRKGVEEEVRSAGNVYTLARCTRYYDAWSGEDIVYAVYYKSAEKKGRKSSAGWRNGCVAWLRC